MLPGISEKIIAWYQADKKRATIVTSCIVLVLIVICVAAAISYSNLLNEQRKLKEVQDPTKPQTAIYKGKTIATPAYVLAVTPEELKSLLDSRQKIAIVQIDSYADYIKGYISGSNFLSKDEISQGETTFSQTDNVVLVSQDGKEAALAAKKLIISYGYSKEKIRILQGGIKAWKDKGYKLEK